MKYSENGNTIDLNKPAVKIELAKKPEAAAAQGPILPSSLAPRSEYLKPVLVSSNIRDINVPSYGLSRGDTPFFELTHPIEPAIFTARGEPGDVILDGKFVSLDALTTELAKGGSVENLQVVLAPQKAVLEAELNKNPWERKTEFIKTELDHSQIEFLLRSLISAKSASREPLVPGRIRLVIQRARLENDQIITYKVAVVEYEIKTDEQGIRTAVHTDTRVHPSYSSNPEVIVPKEVR